VKVSTTDAEMAVSLAASALVEEAGSAVVPARVLTEVAKSLPDGEVTLEARGGEASLAHGRNAYKLRCYDAKDFPQLPHFPEGDGSSFAVPAAALSEAVSKVLPSVSTDELRPVLTGVLLAFSPDGKATMVSTDSFRMHIVATELGGPGEEKRAIVPARALREAAKLSRMAEEVRVAIRLAGLTPKDKARTLASTIEEHTAKLVPGRFTVITPGAVRIRRTNP
jgi:DNA polymerase III subunit beta